MSKPCCQACENNKKPILEVLVETFAQCTRVLEIGSGTGQHAVFFAHQLPWLRWQTSDLPVNHGAIDSWLADGPGNALAPLALDVHLPQWPDPESFDGVFSANTLHIMAWEGVEALFKGAGRVLAPAGVMCIYGPFIYGGAYTSDGNARFDQWLRDRDPSSGVRDFEAVDELARDAGLELQRDYAMPANNHLLCWRKPG